jgi:signal transduction histidine kinase
VAPRAEPFPNRWQKRVMIWFLLSLLVTVPLALMFARRIVKPLEGFVRAAEVLGRDPAADVVPLSGPAEVGRAARAFNQMRDRLRAFVDDRTAMVGAISHDLRTPLTRLRFRLEDVPDDQRDALLAEVDEMEMMISQVISFIRDASTPGARQRIDLAELVRDAVEDARVMGDRVRLDVVTPIRVEVDPLGIRRLLGNLLENALKYGHQARVRVLVNEQGPWPKSSTMGRASLWKIASGPLNPFPLRTGHRIRQTRQRPWACRMPFDCPRAWWRCAAGTARGRLCRQAGAAHAL